MKIGISLSAVAIILSAGFAVAENKKPSKTTGACTITVYGVSPTCTAPMAQESCNATAKKVGGVADWKEGKGCPRK